MVTVTSLEKHTPSTTLFTYLFFGEGLESCFRRNKTFKCAFSIPCRKGFAKKKGIVHIPIHCNIYINFSMLKPLRQTEKLLLLDTQAANTDSI